MSGLFTSPRLGSYERYENDGVGFGVDGDDQNEAKLNLGEIIKSRWLTQLPCKHGAGKH